MCPTLAGPAPTPVVLTATITGAGAGAAAAEAVAAAVSAAVAAAVAVVAVAVWFGVSGTRGGATSNQPLLPRHHPGYNTPRPHSGVYLPRTF